MVACCRVGGTACSSVCMGPFEGGHYLQYLHHRLASGQIIRREHSPTHQQNIKDLLSMTPPISDQCKTTEENNSMGKTRDLLKKIRYIKGTFHAKMGIIKDRNGMDLTEAEDIKKRWQEYTEEVYKKDLQDPIIMML